MNPVGASTVDAGAVEPVSPLLEVRDLTVDITMDESTVHAVRGVSFAISAGEMVALVGESGCGKSITALSLMGLSRQIPGAHVGGHIFFRPRKQLHHGSDSVGVDSVIDVVAAPLGSLRHLRGNEIGIIFQDPMSSLNPVFSVGQQIMEPLLLHRQMTRREAQREAVRLLRIAGVSEPEQRFYQYPHQLSGGMRQRVMISMALSCRPSLLLADEPTTALDVTIQAQIMHLLLRLRQEFGSAVMLITHDLSIVAGTCSRVLVMYAGKLVEMAAAREFFYHPRHPYSRALMDSLPRVDIKRELKSIPGQPPDLTSPPPGCPFAPRCPRARDVCREEMPPLEALGTAVVACHFPLETGA
ncbi:MAG: hypothetical protein B1H03_07375 [Planctomycetales bacterium 4484_113]|nr:MAG: hypothetical protein B1H03_07375 [Planctomycetales bacterium 4484_113]